MYFKDNIKVENSFTDCNNENNIMDVNKFVRNTFEELKVENQETFSEHLNCNRSSTFEVLKKEQASEGNTSRLLDLWEPQIMGTTDMKTNKNVDQVGAVPKEKSNLYDRQHIEEDGAFQLGRQKGIRDILSSLVSPYSPSSDSTKFNYGNTMDSPDLSLSFLEKENLKLLNKLATSSTPISKSGPITNFEDTSTIHASNISKEETRVYTYGHYKDNKTKKADTTLELENQIKIWLKPFYNTDVITKEEYKKIMLKCFKKISCWKGEDKNPVTIRRLVEFYIKKHRMDKSNLKSTKKTRKVSSNETFSNENSLLTPYLPRSKNLLEDVSNKSTYHSTNKISKVTNSDRNTKIKINIKHSCCNKDSLDNDSHNVVISKGKSNEVRRWRY